MAFWIEIRCDVRSNDCYSYHKPSRLTNKPVITAANLTREALAQGWKKMDHGQIACPGCQAKK